MTCHVISSQSWIFLLWISCNHNLRFIIQGLYELSLCDLHVEPDSLDNKATLTMCPKKPYPSLDVGVVGSTAHNCP